MKKTLVSGIQPTGDLHFGNYFGAIKQFVDMQKDYDSYVFIADLHALTTVQNKEELQKYIFNTTAAYIACGLDPEKVTIFQQSAIGGELTQMTWIFNCITTMAYLERAHAYKDAHAKAKEPTVGLFDYPMLMTSDILIHDAHVVPVGADQKQHVEFARDTAQKFNRVWESEVFTLPEPYILESTGVIPGLDGRKMSKSYGNTIPLFISEEELQKKVMSIVTDSDGDIPENVYALHKLFRTKEELKEIYEEHKGKYKNLKEALFRDMNTFLAPLREKYEQLQQNPEIVEQVLARGKEKVTGLAQKKLEEVSKTVGLWK